MDRDSAIELLALNLFEEDEDKDVEDLLDIIENDIKVQLHTRGMIYR